MQIKLHTVTLQYTSDYLTKRLGLAVKNLLTCMNDLIITILTTNTNIWSGRNENNLLIICGLTIILSLSSIQ